MYFNAENEVNGLAFLELEQVDMEKMISKIGIVKILLKIQKVTYMHIHTYVCHRSAYWQLYVYIFANESTYKTLHWVATIMHICSIDWD